MSFEPEGGSKTTPGLAKPKELYFDDWVTIAFSLGNAIIRDNANELSSLITKYFSNEDAKELLNTEIAISYEDGKEFVEVGAPLFSAVESASRNTLSHSWPNVE